MTRKMFVPAFFLLWLCEHAHGHSLGLSLLKLTETAPAVFEVEWRPSETLSRRTSATLPRFSGSCTFRTPRLECSTGGDFVVQFDDLPPHAEVVVQRVALDGEEHFQVLANDEARFSTLETVGETNETGYRYFWIGIDHIVLGADHLLFVLGLLLLTGFQRNLVWVITAFTVSHSITLALTMLNLLSVPAVPVEIIIALSIIFVAREALGRQKTLARRYPWLMAAVFGLIHGLGFAGALADIGLPSAQTGVALLAFNAGVEAGQLAVLGLLFALSRLKLVFLDVQWKVRAAKACCYFIGVAGSFWLVERTVGALS